MSYKRYPVRVLSITLVISLVVNIYGYSSPKFEDTYLRTDRVEMGKRHRYNVDYSFEGDHLLRLYVNKIEITPVVEKRIYKRKEIIELCENSVPVLVGQLGVWPLLLGSILWIFGENNDNREIGRVATASGAGLVGLAFGLEWLRPKTKDLGEITLDRRTIETETDKITAAGVPVYLRFYHPIPTAGAGLGKKYIGTTDVEGKLEVHISELRKDVSYDMLFNRPKVNVGENETSAQIRFPDKILAEKRLEKEKRALEEEKKEYEKAMAAGNVDELLDFAARYPRSEYRKKVADRIFRFAKENEKNGKFFRAYTLYRSVVSLVSLARGQNIVQESENRMGEIFLRALSQIESEKQAYKYFPPRLLDEEAFRSFLEDPLGTKGIIEFQACILQVLPDGMLVIPEFASESREWQHSWGTFLKAKNPMYLFLPNPIFNRRFIDEQRIVISGYVAGAHTYTLASGGTRTVPRVVGIWVELVQ